MLRRSAISATLPLFVVIACSHSPAATPPAPAKVRATPRSGPAPYASTISPDELKRDLYYLASDSFRGRESGTPDAVRAAAWLARRAQLMGLEPAGDSMYMQRVPLVRETLGRGTRFLVADRSRTRMLRLGTDVAPVLTFGDGLPEPKRSADGDIVFLGYGMESASTGSSAPIDIEDRVVVVVHGAPPGTDPKQRAQLESQQALGARLGQLLPGHPAAIIFLMTGGAEEFYRQATPQLLRSVVPAARPTTTSDAQRPLPMVLFGVARSGSPLLPARWPNDNRAQELGRRFTGRIDVQRMPFTGHNVVAVVRGRDPRLTNSYVAFGAHYDHIGIVKPDARAADGDPATDSIANGADDDGSGSVALLAIAKQMMAARPRRSVLFVWHVAEEQGMLGSAYFTEHPTLPMDSVVAQLNADMIGRNDPDHVALVGPRAAPNFQSWRLGMIVDSVNRSYPKPFAIDRAWDDPDHPDQIYQRSDHYNYAKLGIPIIFFTTGLHGDYHRASDEPSKIDYEKMARVAKLMFDAGLAVANRATRPTSEAAEQIVSSRPR